MKKVFVFLAGAALSVTACGGHETERAAAERQPLDVRVMEASVSDVARPFETGGVVRARTTATLVSRIVAEVREVLAVPGDRVRAGAVLVRLDARELRAHQARAEASAAAAEQAVRAARTGRDGAQAALSLAAATHERIAALRAKNSATPNELDQAVSSLRGAEAQAQGAEAGIRQAEAAAVAADAARDAARVAVSYATITAPFDGVVTEKLVEPGNMASPGVPLIRVEDVQGFRLEVRVDEGRAGEIDRTRPVEVVFDSVSSPAGRPAAVAANTAQASSPSTPGGALGRVAEISRALDPGSHAFLVKIDLPQDASLRSGMFGRARFSGPPHRALVIPASALVRQGQLTSVFVVGSDKRARVRLVNVGDGTEGRVEVLAGLDAGERVVVSPPPGLVDGAPVREVRR